MLSGPKKELLDLIKHHGQITIDKAVEKIDLAKTLNEAMNDRVAVGPALVFVLQRKGMEGILHMSRR